MFSINTELAETLITVAGTLITGIAGLVLGKMQTSNNRSSQLHTRQLSELYEPLMAIFLQEGDTLTQGQIDKISKLISEHNALAAPKLVQTWQKLIQENECNFHDFRIILSSNYNWVKKCLGYPYLSEEIKMAHLPDCGLNRPLIICGAVVSAIALVFCIIGLKYSSRLPEKIYSMVFLLISYGTEYYFFTKLVKEQSKI